MRHVWVSLGLLLVVGGAVAPVVAGDPPQDDFGWFACTLLDDVEMLDLRGGELDELRGLDGLRGTTISPLQLGCLAPALARGLGIVVAD